MIKTLDIKIPLDQNHLHITWPPSKLIEKPWYKSTSGLLPILK